ncbi:MAG: hypothetical protein JO146_01860 [Candidatus Eremiobacteraeota bacterium]|nr:hypothetical protein [Candidatus Eremiobacteraeota bacterium]
MRLPPAAVLLVAPFLMTQAANAAEPAQIAMYVTPWYNSSGPVIKVGQYSSGLASQNRAAFVATIRRMKTNWNSLDFLELYVAAIQLYDRGFRNEAIYWFYSAQYQGRLFAMLADRDKLGTIGDRAFELYHGQESFFALAGPDLNGYAFGNIGLLSTIVRRVQAENHAVPKMRQIYPGVAFASESRWPSINADLNTGLGKLATHLDDQRTQIEEERRQNGTDARFGHLTSTPFPGGY